MGKNGRTSAKPDWTPRHDACTGSGRWIAASKLHSAANAPRRPNATPPTETVGSRLRLDREPDACRIFHQVCGTAGIRANRRARCARGRAGKARGFYHAAFNHELLELHETFARYARSEGCGNIVLGLGSCVLRPLSRRARYAQSGGWRGGSPLPCASGSEAEVWRMAQGHKTQDVRHKTVARCARSGMWRNDAAFTARSSRSLDPTNAIYPQSESVATSSWVLGLASFTPTCRICAKRGVEDGDNSRNS